MTRSACQVEESKSIYKNFLSEEGVDYNMGLIADMRPAEVLDSEMFNLLN